MSNYIDGFVFPLHKNDLETYKDAAHKIAEIWKEYGAISYNEFVGDDMSLEGTQSFTDILNLNKDEVVIFGWLVFPSKDARDLANQEVPNDPRMIELVAPIMNPEKLIFNAERMVYGGFKQIVHA